MESINKHLDHLRSRAHQLLAFQPEKDKKNIELFIDELLLYQVELEIQNLDLCEKQDELAVCYHKYFNLYDKSSISYFTLSTNGLIQEVNMEGAKLLGISKDVLINRSFTRYIIPDDQFIFLNSRKNAFKNGIFPHCNVKMLTRHGPIINVNIEGEVLNSTSDQLLIKITETSLNNPEYTLAHVKKCYDHAAYGEITSILLHELNHPLGVISNYIYGTLRRLEVNSYQTAELITAMHNSLLQLKRISEIILRMKNFFYKEDNNLKLESIDELIKDSIELIKAEFQDFPVMIHYREYPKLPHAYIDKFSIQQVMLNLARNAIDAMRDAQTEEPKLIVEANLHGIDNIHILIVDNGPGFPIDIKNKLFDPSFTTKPYGIGLGLSLCRKIIEMHNGTITASLNKTYGACFTIDLPVNRVA